MHKPYRSELNTRGQILQARRRSVDIDIWRTTYPGSEIGFFCRIRESVGRVRRGHNESEELTPAGRTPKRPFALWRVFRGSSSQGAQRQRLS